MDEFVKHYKSKQMDLVFSALGHATRREMLGMLANRDYSVTELAGAFSISLNVASKHIRVLERAQLVKREIEGRVHRLQFEAQPLQDATEWILRYKPFWQHSFHALSEYVDQLQKKEIE